MNPPVSIAVFPVAGLGTRFLPATKSIPKEMLPVVDKPLMAYALEEAYRAGIRQFVFVTSRHKKALEDYFDDHPEMQEELEAAGKAELLDVLKQTRPRDASFFFTRQNQPRGTGHALYCAEPLVREQAFAVLFPDELMVDEGQPALGELVSAYARTGFSVLGVMDVPVEQTRSYGIVVPSETLDTDLVLASGIVEKPKSNPPSRLATVGRYVFAPGFMQRLAAIQDIVHGREVYMTDAIQAAAEAGQVVAKTMSAQRFDCGSKQGYLQANAYLAMRHPELGPEFREFVSVALTSR